MDEVTRCYQLLGLPDPSSEDEIKRAYRDLVKVWHPDRFSHDERLRLMAQDKLKEINGAYEFLRAKLFSDSIAPEPPASDGPDPVPADSPPETSADSTPIRSGRQGIWWLSIGAAALLLLAVGGLAFKKWGRATVKPAPRNIIVNSNAPIIADYLFTAADDFVVDVFRNGERVPDGHRKMISEIFGATCEKIDMTVREGDWLVFNVVNNRFRWDRNYYFATAGLRGDGQIAFTSELQSGRWSSCDDPAEVPRFIAEPGYLATNRAHAVHPVWSRGNELMQGFTKKNWHGEPLWGTNRNTWVKFNATPGLPTNSTTQP